MPPALEREEFYWSNGRLQTERISRRTTKSHWPRKRRDELVMTIEDVGDRRKITYGPLATPGRIAQAMNRYRNVECDSRTRDIGREIPPSLTQNVTSTCEDFVKKIVRQFSALAGEERTSGVFIGDLNGATFEVDGWSATIYVSGHSSATKEPLVGADIGVVIDIRNRSGRTVKGFLIQAKRPEDVPNDLRSIADLSDQVAKMTRRTDEAYVVIYSPDDVAIYHSSDLNRPLTVAEVFREALGCSRGDRSPEVIAEAIDEHLVLEVAIAGPQAVWPFNRGRLN